MSSLLSLPWGGLFYLLIILPTSSTIFPDFCKVKLAIFLRFLSITFDNFVIPKLLLKSVYSSKPLNSI